MLYLSLWWQCRVLCTTIQKRFVIFSSISPIRTVNNSLASWFFFIWNYLKITSLKVLFKLEIKVLKGFSMPWVVFIIDRTANNCGIGGVLDNWINDANPSVHFRIWTCRNGILLRFWWGRRN
ncbi:unnamed protein product [Blepharisma stoltei]|uniref:Uncharacterized protein n=1 Tax=Blepharisma stoltei TaxID=1481888 RepID=A0AAU9JA81_9CILI|nr:unnamed protein product [Blepharisma stoltei]